VASAGLPTAVPVFLPTCRPDVVLGDSPFRRSLVVALRRLLAVLPGTALTTALVSGLPVLFGSSSAAGLLLTGGLLLSLGPSELSGSLPRSRFFEPVRPALAILLTALELRARGALLSALDPAAHTLFAALSTLSVPFVVPRDTSAAAPEPRLLVAFGLLAALPSAVLLTPVLLSATLLSPVLLVLSFGASAPLAPTLTLRCLSPVSVSILVPSLGSSLPVPLLPASSLSALSVLADVVGSFVLVVWHG
jgi:hypothetical protein